MTSGSKIFDPNVFETDIDFYVQTDVRFRAGSEAAGCRLEQGFNFLDFLVPPDRLRATRHARNELGGNPVGAELYRIQTETAEPIMVAIEIQPLSEGGRPCGLRVTVTDVHNGRLPGTPTPVRGVKPFSD